MTQRSMAVSHKKSRAGAWAAGPRQNKTHAQNDSFSAGRSWPIQRTRHAHTLLQKNFSDTSSTKAL